MGRNAEQRYFHGASPRVTGEDDGWARAGELLPHRRRNEQRRPPSRYCTSLPEDASVMGQVRGSREVLQACAGEGGVKGGWPITIFSPVRSVRRRVSLTKSISASSSSPPTCLHRESCSPIVAVAQTIHSPIQDAAAVSELPARPSAPCHTFTQRARYVLHLPSNSS